MRQLLTLFLLFAFTAQTFSQAVLVADYYFNATSFAKKCENKDKPRLHCNGKCQMMKKLKHEEKKDRQSRNTKTNHTITTLSSRSFFLTVPVISSSDNVYYTLANTIAIIERNSDIFHPPQLAPGNDSCL